MKVFKFKKYKNGYEHGKQGTPRRYLLEIEDFLESQDKRHPGSTALANLGDTSMSGPSNSVASPVMSPLPSVPTTEPVVLIVSKDAMLLTLRFEASHKGKVSV